VGLTKKLGHRGIGFFFLDIMTEADMSRLLYILTEN
jgi:hypothetical protein